MPLFTLFNLRVYKTRRSSKAITAFTRRRPSFRLALAQTRKDSTKKMKNPKTINEKEKHFPCQDDSNGMNKDASLERQEMHIEALTPAI